MNKIASVRSLVKAVGERLPGFRVKGRLIFAEPLEFLLRGYSFDSSAFSKTSFYPTAFVQPLYTNSDYIYFTFGDRLRVPGGGSGWELDVENSEKGLSEVMQAVLEQGLPFLESIRTPHDLAFACESCPKTSLPYYEWRPNDINVMENAAYSWLLAGNVKKCRYLFESIHKKIMSSDDNREWVLELDARTQRMAMLLIKGQKSIALEQLGDWTRNCARALKLDSFLKTSFSA